MQKDDHIFDTAVMIYLDPGGCAVEKKKWYFCQDLCPVASLLGSTIPTLATIDTIYVDG